MAIEQPNAEILVNYPPMIPGATRNVIPYTPVPPEEVVEGAPLALFKPVLNQQGVLANAVKVLVDPPPRDTPSDDSISIELRLNGVSLENRPIPVADRDQRTEFTLFESSLLDDRNNRLEYKIHRPSGNVADSRPLWVLYSEQLPGGNTVPGDDEHPYLDISLPPELGDPPVIGKDDVDKGVALTVFYPFMKAYDDISVELRRERFTFTVQPAQVGQPVVIPLTRAMFEQAGNSADFAISYTVVDQLNNPTQRRRWSITLKADVDVNRVVLDAPILREDLTDTGDDASIVDRDKLSGAPLNVVVVPKKPQFEVGDIVAGRYTGTPSGMDVEFTGPIETDGFGGFKLCIMKIPNDQVVLDDQARAAFTLRRNGIDVGTSKTATARVIGKGAITLNPPTLVAPATSPIDALAYTNGVTARVTFAANPGDRALLKEINPAPGAMPFAEQDFIAGRSDFILSPAFLVARQDKDIELTWTLIRGGMPVGESLPLGLRVNPMADGDTRLPTPTITAVTDGVTLDLTRFSGNTNVLVDAWRGIAINQPIWMQGDGTTVSGDPVTLPIHRGVPITSTGSQGGVVTRAFLDQLADGSTIKVIVAVNVDGFPNEATSVKFPARTYTVKAVALATPAITSVKGSPSGVEIPHGEETTETSLTLTGTASAGQTVQLYNGSSPIGGVITVGADRNWTITLTGLSVATYSIVARGLYGTQPQSPARSVIVTAIVTPAITSVKGYPSGVEIPHGKETTETSLTLTGTASAGQKVQLYNGGSPIGGVITVGADRNWTITLTGLSVATYSIVARGLYGTQPQSPARSVIVTAIVTPAITSIKGSPSGVEIPHGKETTETSLTLTGTASAGQKVQLYNGGSPIGGVITVGADRNWTITLTGLSVATYSIVARGLYGTQPQSPARSVIVTAIVTPAITSIKGSPSGVEIPHGKETTETSLTLTGTASAGQTVQLYNGGSPIGGVITVGADRNWTITLTGLSVATYSIVARGLYGTQPQSPARSVIVTAIVTPAITSIKGSPSGVEIPHGKETTETSLTLTGTASAGQKVQLYNGGSPIGGVITVGADRNWTITLTGLSVATYSIVARGLYGTQPQSPARSVIVTAIATPAITSVKGSPSGVEIPDNGTTVETSITLTGTASKGQKVEIFDGSGASAVSKGTATANATTGIWNLPITVAQGAHRLYAQSKYHSSPVFSNVRNLTVVAVVTPAITSVKGSPSNVEIPNNGTTVETSVILTGKATAGLTVQLYNGATTIGPVITVTANGDWTTTLTGLSINTTYSIKARALYGAQPESAVWRVTVESRIIVENFESSAIQPITNRPIQLPTMTLKDPFPIGSNNLSISTPTTTTPGKIEGKVVIISGVSPTGTSSGTIEMDINFICSRLSFWYYSGVYGPSSKMLITCYNTSGTEIYTDWPNIKITGAREYTINIANIKRMRIYVAGSVLFFDNISMTKQ